jgi:SAM-dependent methyltransferase
MSTTEFSTAEAATRQSYAKNASHWATANYHSDHWKPALDRFRQFLPSGSSIIEIGCGHAPDASRLIAAGYHYLGTDAVPEMVEQARKHNPGARFQMADVYHLPFSAGSFDGFWAAAIFLHLDNVGAALAELHRVLRAPGIGFISIKEGSGKTLTHEPDGDEIMYDRLFHFFTEPEFRQQLSAAGFEVVNFVRRPDPDPKRPDVTWLEFIVKAQ